MKGSVRLPLEADRRIFTPLARAAEAYDLADKGQAGKVVICFDEELK